MNDSNFKKTAKKILIISSSPRIGGNSDLLCDQFASGASSVGNRVEKIRLAEKTIGYCTACGACSSGACPRGDDVPAILEKMLAADIIVLATPVYFYTVCAQLKALLDRSVAIFPRLTGKKYYYIMTMADTNREMLSGTIAALRGFLDCYEGSVEAGMICGIGVYEKGEVRGRPVWDEAYRAGSNA